MPRGKKRSFTRVTRRTYRGASSYGGKSLFTLAKAFAKPGAKLATTYMKKALGLNTETHWLDTIETNAATSSTMSPLSTPLTIPIGDTCNTRTGASCRLTSYTCKLRIMANTAATTTCLVRVIFVTIKDTRGQTFGASTFLDSNTRITSQYNMGDAVSSVGYNIIYDRTFELALSGDERSTKLINFNYRPLAHHLKWDSADTTGTASSLISGFVKGFIMTSETGANTPNYWADHRVKFVDN